MYKKITIRCVGESVSNLPSLTKNFALQGSHVSPAYTFSGGGVIITMLEVRLFVSNIREM